MFGLYTEIGLDLIMVMDTYCTQDMCYLAIMISCMSLNTVVICILISFGLYKC